MLISFLLTLSSALLVFYIMIGVIVSAMIKRLELHKRIKWNPVKRALLWPYIIYLSFDLN